VQEIADSNDKLCSYRKDGNLVMVCKSCMLKMDWYDTICPRCKTVENIAVNVAFANNPDSQKLDGKLAILCQECRKYLFHSTK
jgi:predicted amidophosphoribosyltransferase